MDAGAGADADGAAIRGDLSHVAESEHRPVKAVNIVICQTCLVRWPCLAKNEEIKLAATRDA